MRTSEAQHSKRRGHDNEATAPALQHAWQHSLFGNAAVRERGLFLAVSAVYLKSNTERQLVLAIITARRAWMDASRTGMKSRGGPHLDGMYGAQVVDGNLPCMHLGALFHKQA